MSKRIKAFFTRVALWLQSFWRKEEPKLAASMRDLPEDVTKAATWLSALGASLGKLLKSVLGAFLDLSKWWAVIKYGAIVAALIVSLGGSWFAGRAPVPTLKARLAAANTQLTNAAKQIAGLSTDLEKADKTITAQNDKINSLMATASTPKSKAKTSGNTQGASRDRRTKAAATSPSVNWWNGIVGN